MRTLLYGKYTSTGEMTRMRNILYGTQTSTGEEVVEVMYYIDTIARGYTDEIILKVLFRDGGNDFLMERRTSRFELIHNGVNDGRAILEILPSITFKRKIEMARHPKSDARKLWNCLSSVGFQRRDGGR